MDILPDDAPAPRLCHLIKWPDFDGYGFNLHAERSNPGQFIGKIDDESPAQLAGLREADRIVEVNGVNINNENHRQVVERIKSNAQETKLLVVDSATDLWYKEHDLVVKSSMLNVVYIKTPVPRPQPDSPRAKFHTNNTNMMDSATTQTPTTSSNSIDSTASTPDNELMHQQGAGPQLVASSSLSPSTVGSSLETSDYNDDSIEHQHTTSTPQAAPVGSAAATATTATTPAKVLPSPPPMSPDSGKGDEESAPNNACMIIEAEINRQSPVKQLQQYQRQQQQQQQVAGDQDEPVISQREVIDTSTVARATSGAGKVKSEDQQQQQDEQEEKHFEPDSLSNSALDTQQQVDAQTLEDGKLGGATVCQVSKARVDFFSNQLSFFSLSLSLCFCLCVCATLFTFTCSHLLACVCTWPYLYRYKYR